MNKVLLDLDTLVVRPRIAIDGESYEILSPDELPVLTSHLLSSKGRRMDELMRSSKLSKAEGTELTTIVRQISDTVMEPVPGNVRDKLSDTQRMAVVEVFSTLLLRGKATAAAATIERMALNDQRSTGEETSPDSSASTADSRTGGSGEPRSRS